MTVQKRPSLSSSSTRAHPEPKRRKMAEIVRRQLEEQRAAKQAEAERLLAEANAEPNGHDHPSGSGDADEEKPAERDPPQEEEKEDVPDDEAIAAMQEELEELQKKKHMLFVKL